MKLIAVALVVGSMTGILISSCITCTGPGQPQRRPVPPPARSLAIEQSDGSRARIQKWQDPRVTCYTMAGGGGEPAISCIRNDRVWQEINATKGY